MNPVDLVKLQRRVAAARGTATPVSWELLAKQERVPAKTLQEMHARYMEDHQEDGDPFGQVDEVVDSYNALLHAFGEVAADPKTSPAVKIRALWSIANLLGRKTNLLIAVGRVPKNIDAYRHVERWTELLGTLVDVMVRYGLPPEGLEECLKILDSTERTAAEARTLVPPPAT